MKELNPKWGSSCNCSRYNSRNATRRNDLWIRI